MSTRVKMNSPEFYKERRKWYSKLKRAGFHDIEGGNEHAHILQQHGGGANTVTSLNAVQARSGRPMHQLDSYTQGSEWEQLISDQDFRGGKQMYMHYAQLIVAQEYELRRLGDFRTASRQRLAWSLHAQGVSEREIAIEVEETRHQIRKYIAQLDAMVHIAIDMDYGS